MAELEAAEAMGGDTGVELRKDRDGLWERHLRVSDRDPDEYGGYCSAHETEHVLAAEADDGLTVEDELRTWTLRNGWAVTICPVCLGGTLDGPENPQAAARRLLVSEWNREALRTGFEPDRELTPQERMDELEADMQAEVDALEERVTDLENRLDRFFETEYGTKGTYTTEDL